MARRGEPGRGPASPSPGPEPRWTNAFLSLVAELAVRPRRHDRALPLIWLAGAHHGGAVLDALAGQLSSPGWYRVPHGRLTAPPPGGLGAPNQAESETRPLLDQLCRKLSRPKFGAGRLWFRRYALAAWLLDQDLSDLRSDDVPGELVRRLRGRSRPRHRAGLSDRGDLSGEGLFGVFAVLSWLLSRLVPQVVFRVAVSGRVPGIGRRYRWFMRQRYLAPARSGTFLGLAERLTVGCRDDEPPDQIDKLLVHAFLEDLRHAYLRRPWRIQGWRRTAYPIALIDGVAPGTAPHALLRLIDDVRHETGRRDPLLFIGAGERARRGTAPAAPAIAPGDLEQAYRAWATAPPRTRRTRRTRRTWRTWRTSRTRRTHGSGTWIWPIDVPGRRTAPADAGSGRADEGRPPSFVAPKPPWFARRTVAAAACLMIVVSAGGVVATRSGWPGCGHSPLDRAISVRELGGQCIGFSASDGFRFNDQPGQEPLVGVQRRIFAQNRQVGAIWERSGGRRPLVTLAYLGTLTGRENATLPREEAYVAEREDLEGLAVAQYDGIHTSEPGTPLLRVVVANAGFQMRYAKEAVRMIVDLAHRDRTLIGVVGLVESRKVTGEALRMLNQAEILAIAPTLSADGMYGYSRLYLQVSAPNRDQARLVERYASTVLRVAGVRVYYTLGEWSTPADDHYVGTLLADLKREFGRRLERVTEFDRAASVTGDCGYRGMVFFAGRWSEFASFIERISKACGDNPPAHLVADDSVNRYMANPKVREGAPGNIPLTYVSKGALATCDGLRRRTREEAAGRFLRLLQAPDLLSPARCGPARSNTPVGERVGLSYDAAMIVLRAVRDLADRRSTPPRRWDPRSITPVGVHASILRQNLARPFPGVTGDIRFDDHGEPVDKVIFLVRAESVPETGTAPTLVFRCGTARKGDPATCRRR